MTTVIPSTVTIYEIQSRDEDFAGHFSSHPSTEPQGLDFFTFGFLQNRDGTFYHEDFEGNTAFAVRRIDRILPSSAIKKALKEKIDLIETRQARTVGRKEKQELKQQIIDDLLPKTLTKESIVYCYTDKKARYLFIGATGKRAEETVTLLVNACGRDFVFKPLVFNDAEGFMSRLLRNDSEGGFEVGSSVKLNRNNGKATISHADLSESDVQKLCHSARIEKISMSWEEQLDLNFDAKGLLGGIRMLDVLQDGEEEGQDAMQVILIEKLCMLTDALREATQ